MTLQNYLVIVIGENDNNSPSIKQQVTAEYQAGEVIFAHAPIGSNNIVTMNGLYDALTNSMYDFVIVAMSSALDKTDIERAVAKFDEERDTSQKPLLRKCAGSLTLEWRGQYDFASAIVVAKRVDLFDALKAKMTRGSTRTKGENA